MQLTHFKPIFHFYTPRKHQKTRFSDVFRRYRSRTMVENRLINFTGSLDQPENKQYLSLENIQKVRSLKIPEFWPPPSPLVCPCSFSTPPPSPAKVRSFWLELTLSPSIHILVKFREKEINNESSYLSLNSTCLLRSHSGISINWAPVAHGESVRFMEMSAL